MLFLIIHPILSTPWVYFRDDYVSLAFRRCAMRAVRIHKHGGVEVLKIEEMPKPTAEPGEILLEMKAAGINHIIFYGSVRISQKEFTQ